MKPDVHIPGKVQTLRTTYEQVAESAVSPQSPVRESPRRRTRDPLSPLQTNAPAFIDQPSPNSVPQTPVVTDAAAAHTHLAAELSAKAANAVSMGVDPAVQPVADRVLQSIKVHSHMVDFVARISAAEVQYAEALRVVLQSTIDLLDTGVEIPSAFACVAESVDAVSTLHSTYAEQLQSLVLPTLSNFQPVVAFLNELKQAQVSEPESFASVCMRFGDMESERLETVKEAMISHQSIRSMLLEQESNICKERQMDVEYVRPSDEANLATQEELQRNRSFQHAQQSVKGHTPKGSNRVVFATGGPIVLGYAAGPPVDTDSEEEYSEDDGDDAELDEDMEVDDGFDDYMLENRDEGVSPTNDADEEDEEDEASSFIVKDDEDEAAMEAVMAEERSVLYDDSDEHEAHDKSADEGHSDSDDDNEAPFALSDGSAELEGSMIVHEDVEDPSEFLSGPAASARNDENEDADDHADASSPATDAVDADEALDQDLDKALEEPLDMADSADSDAKADADAASDATEGVEQEQPIDSVGALAGAPGRLAIPAASPLAQRAATATLAWIDPQPVGTTAALLSATAVSPVRSAAVMIDAAVQTDAAAEQSAGEPRPAAAADAGPPAPATPRVESASDDRRSRLSLTGSMVSLTESPLGAGDGADPEDDEFAAWLQELVTSMMANGMDLEAASRIVEMHDDIRRNRSKAVQLTRELEALRRQYARLQNTHAAMAVEGDAVAAAAPSEAVPAAAASASVEALKSSAGDDDEGGEGSGSVVAGSEEDAKLQKQLASMKKKVKKYKQEVKRLTVETEAQRVQYSELERRLSKADKERSEAATGASHAPLSPLTAKEPVLAHASMKEAMEALSSSNPATAGASLRRLPSITNPKAIDFLRVYRTNDSYKTMAFSNTTTVDDLLRAVCEKCDMAPVEKYAIYESVHGVSHVTIDRLVDGTELVCNLRGLWRLSNAGSNQSTQAERRISVRLRRAGGAQTLLGDGDAHVPSRLRNMRRSFLLQNSPPPADLAAGAASAAAATASPEGARRSSNPFSKKDGLFMLFSGRM